MDKENCHVISNQERGGKGSKSKGKKVGSTTIRNKSKLHKHEYQAPTQHIIQYRPNVKTSLNGKQMRDLSGSVHILD